MKKVERWGVFELALDGKSDGNPFVDYEITAVFKGEHETKKVTGFYDGDGVYKVRFMPSYEGKYQYKVSGTFSDMTEEGEFSVTAPELTENHGDVKIVDQIYLEYADGTPYYSIGTTCYAWIHQTEKLQRQTLETLKNSSFNKIRFCIFPKFYKYNTREPQLYPYLRGTKHGQDEERLAKMIHMSFHTEDVIEDITDFDFYQFNPDFFQALDQKVEALLQLGIQADIILLHPYDKWGFSCMTKECDELYLKYVVARYSAYRNVWWSMANEYDLMTKTVEEWDELGELVTSEDPYGHLCSIHNCLQFFDYNKRWITHCSMQRTDLYTCVEHTDKYLKEYKKPVLWDEICYEGDIAMGWGNITGQEMVRRFWEAALRGGYAGHGETYEDENDILWWSHGGELHGNSELRLAFLKKILQETPGKYLKHVDGMFDELVAVPVQEETKPFNFMTGPVFYDYEILYYGFMRPGYREFEFPENEQYKVEVIDTWNMTVTDAGIHSGYTKIKLPARQYMAIRLIRQ